MVHAPNRTKPSKPDNNLVVNHPIASNTQTKQKAQMFLLVLLLAVALQSASGDVWLDTDALKNGEVTLGGLNPDGFASANDEPDDWSRGASYTFEKNDWIVIQYTRKGHINKLRSYTKTRKFRFLKREPLGKEKLVFKSKKGTEVKFTKQEFIDLVENFKVFKPLEHDKSNIALPVVSMRKDSKGAPGYLKIARMLKPWKGERKFNPFDHNARGMFLITYIGSNNKVTATKTKMFEFVGSMEGKLVFVEGSVVGLSFKAKKWSTDEFAEMIRDGEVAQPVQNAVARTENQDVTFYESLKFKYINVDAPPFTPHFIDRNPTAMQAVEDYYRYEGYDDFKEDYGEYDDFQDYDGYDGYMTYDRGFEAGYRSALRQLARK